MEQVIPMIYRQISSDSENESGKLVEYYNGASTEQRIAMNEMCIFMCGWSLETILERCGFSIDGDTGDIKL